MIRDYQIKGRDFILSNYSRCILGDEAGLGKTLTALLVVKELKEYPVLCISTKPGLYVWKNEIKKWLNEESYVYSGPLNKRKKAFTQFLSNPKFLITNYAFVKELYKLIGNTYFKVVIPDEFHLPGILNHKTNIYRDFKLLTHWTSNLIMPTGTPMRSTPADLYAPLSLIDPKMFTSYWSFVRQYCITIKTEYGYTIEPFPKDIKAFREMLHSKYLIRRLKDQVLKELPEKTRQAITVEMEPEQEKVYNQLVEDMYFDYGNKFLATPNALSLRTRIRQLLITPQILGLPIIGGGLKMLHEIAQEEISLGRPIAVFTPFAKAIKYIKEILIGLYKNNIYIIQGGMPAQKIEDTVRAFQENESNKKAVIATIKSGISQTITDAKTAIFLGYEWGPHDNEQAEDRLHRIGQHDNVRCLYLLHKGTPEEDMINRLNSKKKATNFVLSPQEFYERMIGSVN